MALDMDEIQEKLHEDQERIDALIKEQVAGDLSQEKADELHQLQEERIDLLNMASNDDTANLFGDSLVSVLHDALGDNADSGLQKISDMLREDSSISPQAAILSVLAEYDSSIDTSIARECLLATGYDSVDHSDFSDSAVLRSHSIDSQSDLDNIAKAISKTVPDGLCSKYVDAKGDLLDLENSVTKLDDILSRTNDIQVRTPILQERAGFLTEIEQRIGNLHAIGAEVFSDTAKGASVEETMQRFDVARLDDIRAERDEFRLTGDEKSAIGKQEEYQDLLESIRMQASRHPEGFAAKFVAALDNSDAAAAKVDGSKYLLSDERQQLKTDYLEKFSELRGVISEAHFFVDASKAEQVKNEVERNEIKGDVTQRMDARAIVDYKALEISHERKSGEDFPFAKEILGDKVDSKFNYLENIAKVAPDSLSAQYVDAKHQIDDKTAEISRLEEQYQKTDADSPDRTELLHHIDELKADIPTLESKLQDIELRAGAIVESTKNDAQVDQDRLIAKVYSLDKEIQAGGLDAVSLGANQLDIDNYMSEIRAIAKEDPQGSCADFAREYDARRAMDAEVFNARQDAFADRTDLSDSHQEVKSIEVQWSNLQEHVDRIGSEAEICVDGFDTYGRIDTPPDPVDNEQQLDLGLTPNRNTDKETDKDSGSSSSSTTQDQESTAYDRAKANYEAVKDKYNFRNFFVCAERLAYNIEAYKTGQPGANGKPVSGGDIAMNIIELTRTNIWESIIEIKIRDYFDKHFPAKEAQDVEKQQGPSVHKINTPHDAATDVNGIFHDDGFIDKKDPRQGTDKGSEENPGFGRYWGADLTQEVRGRSNDISTVLRNCGRGFTDSVVVDGKMETIRIPPIRLVEMGTDHYLIDPFGRTLYSNVTTDSKDMEVQQHYSKPYFEAFDISRGRFNGELMEAGAAAKGISLDEYKEMLTERCKSDYIDNGLRFFAVHGDYLEHFLVLNVHEEIDYTKDKIDFLHGLQLDKEAELKSITVETPGAEEKAKRLTDEIKVCKACQDDLSIKLDNLRDRLEKINDTLDAYQSAAEICRGKEFGDDVKFSAVLRGEVNGQGKVDKVSYGISAAQEERVQSVLDKFDYKFNRDRSPVDVEQKHDTAGNIDQKEIEAKRTELIKEYGFDVDKIKSMDHAVEKLGIEKAEQNYSPREWAEYMLYRDDMDKYIKEKEEAIEKPEESPKDVSEPAEKPEKDVEEDTKKEAQTAKEDESSPDKKVENNQEPDTADKKIEKETTDSDSPDKPEKSDTEESQAVKEEEKTSDNSVESPAEPDTSEAKLGKEDDNPDNADKPDTAAIEKEDSDKTDTVGKSDTDKSDVPATKDNADTKDTDKESRIDFDGKRPDYAAMQEIGEKIGIDADKLMAMDALVSAYGPDIRESTENLSWDKYDEFIEQFTADTAADQPDSHEADDIDDADLNDDWGKLISKALHEDAAATTVPKFDMEALLERAAARRENPDITEENVDRKEAAEDQQDAKIDAAAPASDIEESTPAAGIEEDNPGAEVEGKASATDADEKSAAIEAPFDSSDTQEHFVDSSQNTSPVDREEKNFDAGAIAEGEQQLKNNAVDWAPGEIKDYGDVVYVDGFCMNHEQLDEYLKGPMSRDEIAEVIDKYIAAGHDSEDSFSFREDFLEPSKYRVDISDVLDAFADKMRDIQADIDNGEPPSQDTVDMMVDCLCSIRDAAVDDFTENIVSVLDRIDEIFISEPNIGGEVADKYMDAVMEMAEPVLSGFHAYDTEQANLVDIVSDRLEMYQYTWDNADISGFVDATMELNSVFNGFAEMLTHVGNEFSGADVDAAATQDLDAGLDAQQTDMPTNDDGLDFLQPDFADNPSDMPAEFAEDTSDMQEHNVDAQQPDVFDPALYDTETNRDQDVDMDAGEDGLDDLDKAADSLSDLGDMLRGIESLSDTMSDLDRDDYMSYLGGE